MNSYLPNDSFPASHPQWCGPLGYQGSKAAMKPISQADRVVALGSRLGPFGTLPQHGMDYWPKDAKIIQIDADHNMLGLVKKITVGICGDVRDAAIALTERLEGRELACDSTREERAARTAAEKEAWETELSEWTHERDDYSLDVIAEAGEEEEGTWLHPPPGPPRAREGHAASGDGLHRHRQHQLGGQLLPAVRGAEVVPRADVLRQLRLRPAHHHRRQGRGTGATRPSRTPATAPGA